MGPEHVHKYLPMTHCIKMTVNDVKFYQCATEFLMRKNNYTAGILHQVGFKILTAVVIEFYLLGYKTM
jgi:hypothetical protein